MKSIHLLAGAAALLLARTGQAQDATRGAELFEQCSTCHSIKAEDRGLQGPHLRGVVGRQAGSLPGFEFSPAMIAAGGARGLVWTETTLDTYLADPEAMIAGTLMGAVTVEDAAERRDLIEFLKQNAN